MKLLELLYGTDVVVNQNDTDIDIKGIAYDSRKVEDGFLFVCIKGFITDGHKYIESAKEKGAVAVMVEDDCDTFGLATLKTENARKSLAQLASNFYGNPEEKLKIIGVTGTNGKTTVTTLIKGVLSFAGKKAGLIGTNVNMIGDTVLPAERTTPESLELFELFSRMVKKGAEYVVMEVSSHSLDLFRVYGIEFEAGVFTNLTQDHLDYHITMENYFEAKKKLFDVSKISIINTDDEYGKRLFEAISKDKLSYSIDSLSSLKAENIKISPKGVKFDAQTENEVHKLRLSIPGRFSVYNALAVFSTCMSLGFDSQLICDALLVAKGVKGRAETVYTKTNYTVIIDYAHTPDGLENIIKTVKSFAEGRVITLFGCGGDRDAKKRDIMGEIAGTLSDYCIITSDNPRTEEPMAIIKRIEEGMKRTDCKYTVIENRKEAIGYALNFAKENDCIILAGKGHETYQIIGKEKRDFDEREIIKEFLESK